MTVSTLNQDLAKDDTTNEEKERVVEWSQPSDLLQAQVLKELKHVLAFPSIRRVCQNIQRYQRRIRYSEHLHADIRDLNFGLFTRFPHPICFLRETVPIIWLAEFAIWPEIFGKFLQVIRCIRLKGPSSVALCTVSFFWAQTWE